MVGSVWMCRIRIETLPLDWDRDCIWRGLQDKWMRRTVKKKVRTMKMMKKLMLMTSQLLTEQKESYTMKCLSHNHHQHQHHL